MTSDVVLPGGVDDLRAPSGGNAYDRRLCTALAGMGWSVRESAAHGSWPRPAPADSAGLAATLAGVPDDDLVVIDGLVACGAPDVIGPAARRLRVVVLVHLPLADETGLAPDVAADLDARERATLHAAGAVVATSDWAARRLVAHHRLPADRAHVAAPGVDPAPAAAGTAGGGRLACVAALTPRKGHDLLIEALATVADRDWSCVCVGALDRAPAHVERLRARVAALGLGDRVRFVGPRAGDDLAATYAATDLLVLASRAETYGMVVTEALAYGIPVLATAVGGVPEALGRAPDGALPGLLAPPDDPDALAAALRRWLDDADARRTIRAAALGRRATLGGWDATARAVAAVLSRQPWRNR
jgi:glycosyltransferase involved in cell wall biosynthesis